MSRPREFCEDAVLDRALEVFWRTGYEGASISRLTEAMGINRPSLYAAFGNKEELFQKALDRYIALKTGHLESALAAPNSREVVQRLLYDAAEILTDPSHPVGCLAVQGALSCRDESEPVRRELARIRSSFEDRLRARFEEERRDGRLPADVDPEALARFVGAIGYGMSVQASGGATREQLRQVAETAMRAWPA